MLQLYFQRSAWLGCDLDSTIETTDVNPCINKIMIDVAYIRLLFFIVVYNL